MVCPTSPEVSLGEWGQAVLNRLDGKRYPLSATFELTERCNLACVQCYINQPAKRQGRLSGELTKSKVLSLLDQMAEAGVINLLLTGGEVFLRPDFMDIYLHAKQLGMLVMIFTNGTLVNERIADFLADYPPSLVEITLYGHSREVYEKITRIPGSYARCMQAVELLSRRGVRLSLKTVVLTINQHELRQMEKLAADLSVPFRYDSMMMPRLDGTQQPLSYCLPPQEIVNLESEYLEQQMKVRQVYTEINNGKTRTKNIYSCGAGFHAFHVDSRGRMSMCIMARNPYFDLKKVSLTEGWNLLGNVRGQKRKHETECLSCDAGILCTQCPGWSQLVHGDDETPVEFVCETGRLRLALIKSL